MATKKKGTSNKKQEAESWYDESINSVELKGKVKRVLYDGDSVCKFTLETVNKTPKDNYAHHFITVTLFSGVISVEEDDIIHIEDGYITTQSYGEGKKKSYTTTVICNTLEFIE